MRTQPCHLLLYATLLSIIMPSSLVVDAAEKTANSYPRPGDVFREYSWSTEKYHVFSLKTNLFTIASGVDLQDAIRAEVVVEIANQHLGFEGMSIRLNGNQWYPIHFPSLSPKDPSPSLWFHHWNATIPITLTDIKNGNGNIFEMKVPAECFDGKIHPNGKVTKENPYGEWGPLIPWCPFYALTLRVYYDSARKPHPVGKVLLPAVQSTLALSVDLMVSSKSNNGPIRQVDFLGRYEDINYEGDGVYDQWHGHLFHGKITHHLGSTTQPEGKVIWDTSWVPDQAGPMEIAARITDSAGLIYMTEAVGGLKLVRPGLSVELCKPFDLPRSFTGCQYGEWVIPGIRTQKLTIKGDLSKAIDARYVIASWGNQKECPGYTINGVLLQDKPASTDYYYSLSTPPIRPRTALKAGENTFATVVAKGRMPDIYVPGVQVLVRYNTSEMATNSIRNTSTLGISSEAIAKEEPGQSRQLPQLRVSDNHRFLVTTAGEPFFWLGDTAWELFHRLNREEAMRYLKDRAAKGFTVIQAVALAELDGLTVANPQGHLPLFNQDLNRPNVKEGPDNDYWDDIEWILRRAEEKSLYIGLLPMWGKYCPADTGNSERYGRFIGDRFKDHPNIIWILGGDRPAPSKPEQDAWRAMAKGITIGVSGREDYDRVLMTYHTSGPGHASDFFHKDEWLDFTGIQSSHGDRILNWKMIERDYNRRPIKPVIDLETTYPGLGIMKGMKPGNDEHARRSAYWAVFAGAFGHTYGHNSIWQMAAPGRTSPFPTSTPWFEAIHAPSAIQMGYLRSLIESRPFLTQAPDPTLLSSIVGDDLDHVASLRGDGFALIYTPTGKPFRVRLDSISGKQVTARWFDPRTGETLYDGQFTKEGERDFTPPGSPCLGNDWVLMLDDSLLVHYPDAPNFATRVRVTEQQPPSTLPSRLIQNIRFSQETNAVDVYDYLEVALYPDPTVNSNPFTDVVVAGEFSLVKGGTPIKVDGFCDSQNGDVYRIRFMPSQPGDYRYTVTLRHSGQVLSHKGTFTARRANRLGVLRVDPKHPFHFIWEGAGEHYFWNGTTTYYLMGWQSDAEVRKIIDRLSDLKINRLRVLIYGRNEDRPWGQPVKSTADFKLYLNPWVAQRPDNVKDPGFDLRRFNVAYWQRYERMLAYARQKGMVISVIPFIGAQVLPTPFAAFSEEEQLYYRYAVARLSAFANITWDLGNEHDLNRKEPGWADWLGPLVKQWDAYDHLLSAHNRIYRMAGNSWNDMQLIQRWDGGGQKNFFAEQRKQQAASGRIVPLVNEEYGYEDLWEKKSGERNAESRRRVAWEVCMAGSYQTTGETANRGTGFPPDTGGGWVNGRGDDSMTMLKGYSHMVDFFTSFDWWRTEPRNELVESPATCLATPGMVYAVYLPSPNRVTVRLSGSVSYRARWFNPRNGQWIALPNATGPQWTSPMPPGEGDWALQLTTYDWSTREWKSYFNHDGLQFNNNRWAGEKGSMFVRFGPPTASWWTTHNGNRADFPVSAPWVGVGNDWGNISINSPFPIKLGDLEILKASLSATLPPEKSNQMYKIYWQLYFSDAPTGKFNKGDFAPTVYAVRFPSNHWGVARGNATIDGRLWGFKDQQYSSGMGRYIIPMLEPTLQPDANGTVEIRNVDIKALIDYCIVQGYYSPEDYCMVIGAGWEIFVLDDMLKMNDMAFIIKQKGKPAVTVPAWSSFVKE